MTLRVAINGYGRIGRMIVRAWQERYADQDIEIVAINDLASPELHEHLTRYDSVHGPFAASVALDGDHLVVNGKKIKLLAIRNPAELPWKELNVDVVMECTGLFTSREKAGAHLQAGAKKVLISAPGGEGVDATVVYGVNHQQLSSAMTIVSNASCTTNCLAPMVQPLIDTIGIERGLMTTVHAYTNDQVLLDTDHKDLRRARSAAVSMIPTKTGAAAAVGLVLPQLKGKLDGFAVRVPVSNVSLVDLTFTAGRDTSKEEVNQLITAAANGSLKGVLGVNTLPLVSCDFLHNPASSTFDATLTRVIGGREVKVLAWYDNEWGFSNRMIDTAVAWQAAK
ncbi:type I glyceraldehyde-3-phosphate dehydrogenase [Chromobacterium aquaticum]|uniref:Glyceraldehyde-3-phosphate dehydrogenase n=1 Tax=Chromobacterium aquaticum TaxID=467180 RepID=A0ABV8ZSL9_9NEIS|nr:type I glyceraldehyde-3-phosphate dehydrogenase [Chromobacterium aquaticum]MCD5362087.1 type I glyceraldehyde-3-phosphate dehydrogenase [Chromobacterium aquaticum]